VTVIALEQPGDSDFDRFIRFARQRSGPQILCAVVCEAAPLEEGYGISLSPVTCIDLPVERVTKFRDVVAAGGAIGDWDVMCVTVLANEAGVMPTAIETNKRLDVMLALIRQGMADRMVIFASNEDYLTL